MMESDLTGYALFGVLCAALGYWIGRFSGGIGAPSMSNIERARQAIDKLSKEGRAKVTAAYRDGRKVEAIKFFRADTNAGLREAKDGVELMMLEGQWR